MSWLTCFAFAKIRGASHTAANATLLSFLIAFALPIAPTAAFSEDFDAAATQGLEEAIRIGNPELARFALENNADPNGVAPGLRLPMLHLAGRLSRTSIVALLVANGAGVNVRDANVGYSALMYACGSADRATLRVLIDAQTDLSIRSAERGLTALMLCASRKGGYASVVDLIGAGAPVESRANDGWTALMAASSVGNLESVELLLLNKAGVDHLTDDGRNALYEAVSRGHVTTAKALLGSGAAVNAITADNNTALLSAAANDRPELVAMLIASGATIDVQEASTRTPLTAAIKAASHTSVLQLIAAGADVNRGVEPFAHTPLMLAANRDLSRIVETLLDAGADPGATAIDGWSARAAAEMVGATESIELIDRALR